MGQEFREPVLQLKGQHCLYIENYRKLLCYTDTQIRIQTKTGILEIEGVHLMIPFYSKEDLEISGRIKKISFLE